MKRLTLRTTIILWYTILFVLTLNIIVGVAFTFAIDMLDRVGKDGALRAGITIADKADVASGRFLFDLSDKDARLLTHGVLYGLYGPNGEWRDGRRLDWVDRRNGRERHEGSRGEPGDARRAEQSNGRQDDPQDGPHGGEAARDPWTQWMDQYGDDFGKVRTVRNGDDYWFLYDKPLYDNGAYAGKVRVLLSAQPYYQPMRNMKMLLRVLPLLSLILAAGGGLIIVGRALRPVKRITKTAREIGGGDWSQRIPLPGAKDEVGELATAFNDMADSLEQSFAREKRFTSDVSHELRTPLAVITASAENAQQADDPETYRKANQIILTKSRQIRQMISQMLLFAREREQAGSMVLEEVDLALVLGGVAEEAREWAEEKGIAVEIDVPDGIVVRADLMLLTRMFLNLLDNAVKYGREGGCVRVLAREDRDRRMAVVSVCDNGVGIAEEDMPHIFQRFYRADKARSDGGAGLGLSYVEMIAKLHHGGVSAHSAPGGETCFTVDLPREWA